MRERKRNQKLLSPSAITVKRGTGRLRIWEREPQVQKLSLGLFPDQIEVRKVNQIVMVWSLIRDLRNLSDV